MGETHLGLLENIKIQWKDNNSLEPVLKWAGGKRWFVAEHKHLFPTKFRTYREPFLGGGAVFFAMEPGRAVISDANPELIEFYHILRSRHKVLRDRLQIHQKKHSEVYYRRIRSSAPRLATDRGARFLYLNRSCWNGLYRVNQKGEFNVPMGSRTNFSFETDDFPRAARILRNADLKACDFEENVNEAQKGDFLFVDPPYTVKHNQNGFVKYNEKIFSWDDQIRLRDALVRASRRGVLILATNADHESVRELYEAYPKDFRMVSVKRSSSIAASSRNRGVTTELVVLA
jgi:DNA adenine methylase